MHYGRRSSTHKGRSGFREADIGAERGDRDSERIASRKTALSCLASPDYIFKPQSRSAAGAPRCRLIQVRVTSL